jgi:hypothetical protein
MNVNYKPMSSSEVEKLFRKPGEKRYEYFIKTVGATEEVFGLGDDEGWAMLGDESDADIIPFFPNPETAEAFRIAAEFDEFTVMVLDVNELLEWLTDMEAENTQVAICPNTEYNGAVLAPSLVKEDLVAELAKYDEDGKKIPKV